MYECMIFWIPNKPEGQPMFNVCQRSMKPLKAVPIFFFLSDIAEMGSPQKAARTAQSC